MIVLIFGTNWYRNLKGQKGIEIEGILKGYLFCCFLMQRVDRGVWGRNSEAWRKIVGAFISKFGA